MWIVPGQICAMRYVNYPKFFPGDTSLDGEWLQKADENTVKFSHGWSLSLPKDLTTLRIISVRTIRNTALAEKCLVPHGNIYELHG